MLVLPCAMLALGSLWLAPAAAQTADASTAPEPAAGLETVVVTAQKRSEDLQSVPLSVAVVTADSLLKGHVTGTGDLVAEVPGLSLGEVNGYSLPSLRGVGEYIAINGYESPVASYLDGVYLVQPAAGLFSLTNTQQIEVLRGPQGTLFGRNATGGVVNVITKAPSATPSAWANLGYGNFNTVTADIYATGEVFDNVSANLSISGQDQFTGQIKNLHLGTQPANDRFLAVQNKWLWQPDSATSVTLNLRYDYFSTNLYDGIAPGFLGEDGVTRWAGPRAVYDRIDPVAQTHDYFASLRIDHDFNSLRIMNLAAYRQFSSNQFINQNGIPGDIVNPITGTTPTTLIDPRTDDGQTFTDEFQIQSLPDDKLQWVAGGYFLWDRSSTDQLVNRNETFFFDLVGSIDTKSYAVFGQATYPISTGTRLTLGARYTTDTLSFEGHQTRAPFTVKDGGIDPETTDSAPTFRAALDHDFTDNVLGYVSWNRGFRAGAYTVNNFTNPAVEPEHIDSYEAGVKTTLFNNHLRLNLAAFHYLNSDMQLKATTLGGISRLINAAKARGNGVDIDMDAVITDSFTLSGGVEFLDAKFTSFPGAPCPLDLPQGGVNGTITCDLAGQRLPFAPTMSGNIRADYMFAGLGGEFDVSLGDGFSSGYNFEPDGAIRQPAFNNVTSAVSWSDGGGRYRVTLWGRNLLDEEIYSLGTTNTSRVMVPGKVRTFGITFGAAL